MDEPALEIAFRRLPDLDSLERAAAMGYRSYGRFAILRGGGFWFGGCRSSHPATTEVGWYWAIDGEGRLVVSPRGAQADGERLAGERRDVLARLVEELVRRGELPRPRSIRVEAAGAW